MSESQKVRNIENLLVAFKKQFFHLFQLRVVVRFVHTDTLDFTLYCIICEVALSLLVSHFILPLSVKILMTML